jgi:lysozyme
MVVDDQGLTFIENWEAFRPREYLDAVGMPTIGYGHLILPSERELYQHAVLTEHEGTMLLLNDLNLYCDTVHKVVKCNLPMKCFDALVSLCFNIGIEAFATSTLVRMLNADEFASASHEFQLWCKGGVPLETIPGLVRRREAERRLFVSGMPGLGSLLWLQFTCLSVKPLPLAENYVRLALQAH